MNNFSWEFQEFDTNIFGFKVAKITSISLGNEHQISENVKNLIDDFKGKNIFYATYRFPIENFLLIHVLEKNGFKLVDIFVNLKLEPNGADEGFPTESNIRESTKDDLEELRTLGGKIRSEHE